jgi:hypothetical protein
MDALQGARPQWRTAEAAREGGAAASDSAASDSTASNGTAANGTPADATTAAATTADSSPAKGREGVIAHVVLFTPKASLSADERQALVADLERACQDIPSIRRARVGRRQILGYAYDSVGPVQFEFIVELEFDSKTDLDAYLRHPAHVALGRWFHEGADVAVAEDFAMVEPSALRELVADYVS